MNENLNLKFEKAMVSTRRQFLRRCQVGLGALALNQLMGRDQVAANPTPKFAPKAKRVIYLHMAGSPPQQDLFDYKPKLNDLNGELCPNEFFEGKRLAFIKGHPTLLGSPHKFEQHGDSGTWVTELMPHFSKVVDDVSFIHSMSTDQFNHAPAQLALYTGSPRFGAASMGSWITYGLGSETSDLPSFVVMVSGGTDPSGGKSLWGNGYLPSIHQGVQCRSGGDPILFMNNPDGMSRETRRRSLDTLNRLNQLEAKQFGDPETLTRIGQYELAYRMQIAAPEVMDISRENQSTLDMYGAEPGRGSFANNCLLARRLVEKGVRFVQLFDWGWDIHGTGGGDDLMTQFPRKCKDVDQPISALIRDLKQRGMLDDTLIVWGGEFGRTPMNEARNGSKFLGRDHHGGCFTIWMAGGGVKPGFHYGATDELGYQVVENHVRLPDLQATILHLLGLDPYELSYPYLGLNQRLIGPTNEAKVHHGLIA